MSVTKILIIGDHTNSLLHSRVIEASKYDPEVIIVYANESSKVNGLDYDVILKEDIGKHINVGTIGHPDYNQLMIQFDDCLGFNQSVANVPDKKHTKPFYQKGRW